MSRPNFTIFAQHYISVLLSDFGDIYLNEPIPRNPNLRVFKHPSRFNWGTEYLAAITAGNNRIMVSPEVIGEAELVDILFEPNTEKSRASLGLLGTLVSVPCIIETLRWTPNEWDLRTCMLHWLTWKSEADGSIIPVNESSIATNGQNDECFDEVDKTLLIITPSITPQMLQGLTARASAISGDERQGCIAIPGVYELPSAFCTTIVATSELPQDISTLWLRILGRGSTQRQAILELFALDENYPHRTVVLNQLRQWYRFLSSGKLGKESARLMTLLAMIDGTSKE
jgi:hypothetical protein